MKINIWRYITDANYRKGISALNLSNSSVFDLETTQGRVLVEFKVGDTEKELIEKNRILNEAFNNLTEHARMSVTMRNGSGFETFGMSGKRKIEG